MPVNTTKRKITISFDCLVANGFILMALLLMLAGCVEDHPGHYGSDPQNYTYYPPSHTTVIVTHDDDDQRAYRAYDEDNDGHSYDNHWDYGRRGNGNFHGTGDDDVHDD